jgi:hypothetical protein
VTALSALREKAAARYPDYILELDEGYQVTLKSVMTLDDEELRFFNTSQKKLAELDQSDDKGEVENLKAEMVNLLSGVSSDRARTAEILNGESIGTLSILFEEYAGSLSEGAKSESDS